MKDRHAITPYPIRMPPELRAQLEEAAKEGNRSLHAEIIARLQQSFVVETEFHVGSKITHTPIEQDILEEAAERGAEKAIRGLILIADEAHESAPISDYGALIRKLFLGLDKDDNPVDYNPPRTPAIPGVNAPKRGLGATPRPDKPSKPKKQTMVKKRVFVDTPPNTPKK